MKLRLPEIKAWLPGVAAVLCLSMVAMAAVALFTVGADPESGPQSLPTSIAAQGYQGLRRMLVARGYDTYTNRFEDGGEVTRADIEIITLDDDTGVYNLAGGARARRAMQRAASASSASEQASQEASTAASQSASQAASSAAPSAVASVLYDVDDAYGPDKRRSDHILYHPLGRVVIVIAPKWRSGPTPQNPRWAGTAGMMTAPELRHMLTVLAPVSSQPLPESEEDDEDDGSSSASYTPLPPAPPGKGVYDDDGNLYTFDKVPYDIRQARTNGALILHGAAGQGAFPADLSVDGIGDLQTITGPNLVPVLLGPDARPLISRVAVTDGRAQPKVPVYLVSDPDLLNNQVLSDPKRVIAALGIVGTLAPPHTGKAPSVVFNLTFNRLSFDHDLLHALSRPPYVAVPLSLLLAALALMWASFARFGPPVTEEEGAALGRGVRVLADNAARLMAISLKEAKLGPAYAQMVRDEVLRARGHRQLNPNESTDELADRIGKLYGASESYTALKSKASNLLTVHQLIDVVQKLHAWKTEIDRANI